MVILGVDPGFSVTGFSIMKKEGQKITVLDFGAVRFSSKDTLAKRIGQFYSFFNAKISEHKVTGIALETPFLGKNAQNFLKLGYLRGLLYLLSDQHKLSLSEFSPSSVKMALTGFGAASKDQVARILMRLFPGMAMPKKLDISDALAVTLCGVWKHRGKT